MIIGTSDIGDVILDPFFGSGTTGAVAKALQRNFIGIEREQDYIDFAQKRIDRITSLKGEAVSVTPPKKRKPRIPFGYLVEIGLITPGDSLFTPKGDRSVMVCVDGSLIGEADVRGSIHKLGAIYTGAGACNGWTYWRFLRDGVLVEIDALRQQVYASKEFGLA